jgi:hypothetical protein
MEIMKKSTLPLLLCGCLLVATGIRGAAQAADTAPGASSSATTLHMPKSVLFDNLGQDPDVVYLIANSSVVFGPDPHGRSEEVTFIGPVTVPKWPMKGYGRRVLPDGRQQIDIELTQSELTGESYLLKSPIMLAEHPDLRSLGTITERPKSELVARSEQVEHPKNGVVLASYDVNSKEKKDANSAAAPPKDDGKTAKPAADSTTAKPVANPKSDDAKQDPKDDAAEEVPADFVVERKVLMTTAKGILYNETAVPVRGRINSIPPIKLEGTPTGVNTFRGMEIPVALLDQDGAVNGWFYSKSHMAYAVLPAAIERSYVKGMVQLRSGDKVEMVEIGGPSEIHHQAIPNSNSQTGMEVMMLALRGHSDLLGGDIMFTETFSDRDHFSSGQIRWQQDGASAFDLYVDLYTPSSKLTTHDPLSMSGKFSDCAVTSKLQKGKLNLPMVGGNAHVAANDSKILFDESEKPVVEIVGMSLDLAARI